LRTILRQDKSVSGSFVSMRTRTPNDSMTKEFWANGASLAAFGNLDLATVYSFHRQKIYQRTSYFEKLSRQFSTGSYFRIGILPSKISSQLTSRLMRYVRPDGEQIVSTMRSSATRDTAAYRQSFFDRTISLAPIGS
jgi:hypothetical protein